MNVPASSTMSKSDLKTPTSLPGVGQLISDSIDLYKSSWRLFLWVILLPILATIVAVIVIGAIIATILAVSGGEVTPARIPLLIPPAIVGLLALIIINALGKIALIKAIQLKGQAKVRKLFKPGWPLVTKYIILQLIVGIVILVGFLLLVVPGIVFSIWFIFSSIILVVEGTGGTHAMRRSKYYVRGKFWGILGRILLLVAVIALTAGLASSIDSQVINVIIQLISTFIIAPIATIYTFKLYQAAKASA